MEVPERLKGCGILIHTMRKGDGVYPKVGDVCTVHFEAFLEDGTKIDSSSDIPFEFRVGTGQVIRGWDVAVSKLSKGSIAEITIPPLFAYGSEGLPPKIPPNTVLIYKITVLEIEQ